MVPQGIQVRDKGLSYNKPTAINEGVPRYSKGRLDLITPKATKAFRDTVKAIEERIIAKSVIRKAR